MTRGVNLLPVRYVERIAERRRAALTGASLLLLLSVLGVAAVGQGRQLREAENKRHVEQARTAELQARRTELASFRPLADGIVGRERLLAAAMGTEVSWAAVLTGLSAIFPDDASLTSLVAGSTLPAFGAGRVVEPGDQGSMIGSTDLKGYSVEEFTPGVEQTLQLLDTVTGLAEPRLQEGTADVIGERPVTTFEGSTFLDGAALTGRYRGGLPAEDDVDVPVIGGAGAAPPAATGSAG
jgi:hypothetical protein